MWRYQNLTSAHQNKPMTICCSHPNQSCTGNNKPLIWLIFCILMFSLSLNCFQVVALMEGNLFRDRAHFFLDQTGEHNLHMVFPTIPEFCWRTCWKPWTLVHARKDETLERGPKEHWVTGLAKHHLGGKMSGALHSVPHPWTESGALKFTCEPCTPILFGGFNLTFFEAQNLWRLILMFVSALHMAARSQRPRSDFASANKK